MNMKLKKIIALFLLICPFYGCNNRHNRNASEMEIIPIDPMEADEFIPLSEIADSIKCIQLQVDSGDVMGRIREIIIKKKHIYANIIGSALPVNNDTQVTIEDRKSVV